MYAQTRKDDWILARNFVVSICKLNEFAGQLLKYVLIGMVLVLFYETVSRYIFGAPTSWALIVSKWLLGTLAVCGWGYTYKEGGHVRVDVMYSLLSKRKQALIDVIMTLIFMFPLLGILIRIAIKMAIRSWRTGEIIVESSWMPPAAPFKTIILIGLFLFGLQCLAQFLCDVYYLFKGVELL